MAMSYTSLVADKDTDGSIKNWVNNSTIPSTTVLDEAEQWIYRRLRVRQMLTTATGNIAADATTLSAPTRFLAAKHLMITGANQDEIKMRSPEDVRRGWSYDSASARVTGKPQYFWEDGTTLTFDYKADQQYPYDLLYYETPASLASSSNETNFLTTRAPYLLRCACLGFANDFLKDKTERTYWLGMALGEIQTLNDESDFAKRDIDAVVQVV